MKKKYTVILIAVCLIAGGLYFLDLQKISAAVIFKPGTILRSKVILLANLWFSNQKYQTKDDWVNSGGTVGEYTAEEAAWSAVSGSPFSGYDSINYAGTGGDLDLYSGTVKQDTRTGLWWSDIMAVGVAASTTNNVFTLTADGARPTGGNAIGFCDALNTANFGGNNDWYLPTQKQLQQAYIDGSANNLPNPGYNFWSSTEYSSNAANAWYVALGNGVTSSYTKVTATYVRCVRP